MAASVDISLFLRLRPAISSRQIRPLLVLGLLGFSFWHLAPIRRVDAIWSDNLLTNQARSAPDRLLVLSITPEDVIANGSERLSRKYMADTLELLAESGVDRVLLDFNLGGGLTVDEEAALNRAMRKLGPQRLGLAYEIDAINRTAESLLAQAQTVNLSLPSDPDGRVRTISARRELAPNPCEWLAHGISIESSTPLDLRIDSRKIRQLSLADLHNGVMSPEQLKHKLVIISFDWRVTRSRIYLPVVGQSNRGTILALGTAAALTRYEQVVARLARVQLILYLASLACGFLIGLQAPKLSHALVTIAWLAALNLFLAFQFTLFAGVPSRPFSTIFVAAFALKVALAHRLRISELFLGLMSGVLSPEEVWLWRIFGDRTAPALLFDAMGHLKKANPAALEQLQLSDVFKSGATTPIAQQLMPALGERATLITTHLGRRKIWEVEWPSANLPLDT